jgi:hypothetical protein
MGITTTKQHTQHTTCFEGYGITTTKQHTQGHTLKDWSYDKRNHISSHQTTVLTPDDDHIGWNMWRGETFEE